MSSFIIPMSNLPSLASLSQAQPAQIPTQEDSASFSDILESAVLDMQTTSATSQASLYDLALGGSDDLHNGAIASLKTSASVNFTSSLISAAIGSYNELMRMQI